MTIGVDKESEYIEADSLAILKKVPLDQGFRFTVNGVYGGQTAISLEDFAEKLRQVPTESLRFHYQNGDFRRWIRDTIGDWFLANQLDLYIPQDASDEYLQKELLELVESRLVDLKTQRGLM